MTTLVETRYASSPEAVKKYDTTELRNEFLISNLMQKGKVNLTY
ncbi:5-dehydro-4-deoxy-D-glucuronate isomerase, partial [Maribacter sp. TH_r10]|nr:5-dehydro-4-deoxy-D-glucuronate isomerase [Maribacter sp. TH_r10]